MAQSKASLAQTNRNKLQQISRRLDSNEMLVLLNDGDEVEVCRNTAGNLLPGSKETMTVAEAIKFGAWDSSHGTIDAAVYRNNRDVRLAGSRAYVIVDTGDHPAWKAEAAEERETVTCWTYE